MILLFYNFFITFPVSQSLDAMGIKFVLHYQHKKVRLVMVFLDNILNCLCLKDVLWIIELLNIIRITLQFVLMIVHTNFMMIEFEKLSHHFNYHIAAAMNKKMRCCSIQLSYTIMVSNLIFIPPEYVTKLIGPRHCIWHRLSKNVEKDGTWNNFSLF